MTNESGVIVFIPLTRGRITVIDWEDYESTARGRRWYFRGPSDAGYAATQSSTLHRIIMRAKPDEFIDHINGDRLDNRRSNLRFCSKAENCRNQKARAGARCGYKGVSTHKGGFRARIWHGGKRVCLGVHGSMLAAAIAYDKAAARCFGSFARLNFPEASK